MELPITSQMVSDINYAVKTTAFTSEEKAEIAALVGVSLRAVQLWLAPPDAAQQRDLLPSRIVAGKNLRSLSPEYQRRVEVGLSTLLGGQLSEELIGDTSRGAYNADLGGYLREYTQDIFDTLQEALDRVEAYQKGSASVDPFLAENWVSLTIEPTGDYAWQVVVEYLSDFESPPIGEEPNE